MRTFAPIISTEVLRSRRKQKKATIDKAVEMTGISKQSIMNFEHIEKLSENRTIFNLQAYAQYLGLVLKIDFVDPEVGDSVLAEIQDVKGQLSLLLNRAAI